MAGIWEATPIQRRRSIQPEKGHTYKNITSIKANTPTIGTLNANTNKTENQRTNRFEQNSSKENSKCLKSNKQEHSHESIIKPKSSSILETSVNANIKVKRSLTHTYCPRIHHSKTLKTV